MIEGNVVTVERKLFSVLNHEYTAKKDIVAMKRDMEEKKLARLKGVKTHSTSMFSKGFISRESLHDIDEKISNTELTIMGLDIESKNLEQLLKLSSPFLHTPFIIRNIFVTNEQYVNAGDDIMSVELLDNFYIQLNAKRLAMLCIKLNSEMKTFILATKETKKANYDIMSLYYSEFEEKIKNIDTYTIGDNDFNK